MKERNNKMELLGNAPIPKALMALGIPIMIGMLINALYNLVDAYFVGGLGESQMGAISIVFPLGQVVVGLGLMFGNGAASYLSRLLGRGDKDTANKVASTALYSSVLVGAIIIILVTIFLKPILTLLGATDTIMPYALTYARIYVVSCIFNVFNVTMNNIVTSEGAAKTTIRKGPGIDKAKTGKYTGKGIFTIVEEADGPGASKWGLLKAYQKNRDGWISLDHAQKV